jgi:hypothetical protein
MSRLGGISFGRTTEAFDLQRPDFESHLNGMEGYQKLKKQRERNGVSPQSA